MSLNKTKFEKISITQAMQNNYMVFVMRNNDNETSSGIYCLKFEKNYFDISSKENFSNYLFNNQILVYPLDSEQSVTLLKVKGNDNILVLGSVVKSINGSTIALDILNSSQNFKRCQTETVDGDILEMDILIPDNSHEGADLIFFVNDEPKFHIMRH